MQKLTVVAPIKATEDKVERVKTELLKRAEQTHAKDESYINYNLGWDNENAAHFLVFANWKTKKLWE